MRAPKQNSFFKADSKSFGGKQKNKGNPKEKRTISIRKPIHLVLRSKHATYLWSFLHKNNRGKVDAVFMKQAKLNGIKVYGYENVGNHLHANLLVPSRAAYRKFIRAISGLIPRIVMGCERGRASVLEKFWDARPFTLILEWGRQFRALKRYFLKNRLQAIGFTNQGAREYLKIFSSV
jgi:hypothetical protein